ncbi:MAG: hypothetical protein ACI9CF_000763 [Candidatus Omnitrophota bacterium]|jgi:hypothetical protein
MTGVNIKTIPLALFTIVATLLFAPSSQAYQVDNFNSFLNDYYHSGGKIDYAQAQKNSDKLNIFIASIEALEESEYNGWQVNDKIAFWINVYNAAMINLVLENYPIKKTFGLKAVSYPSNSVQQIKDVWDRGVVWVFGRSMSLNDIEHGTLRRDFNEPRIHFGLVCASIGCPTLRKSAFVGDDLNSQLNEQAYLFINNPIRVRYDVNTNKLYLSPIFKWFRKDFETQGGIKVFLKKHLPEFDANDINAQTGIKWLSYDWSLNESNNEDPN